MKTRKSWKNSEKSVTIIKIERQYKGERSVLMIRVTSTTVLHRPERILFYIPEPDEEVKKSITDGVCPKVFANYQRAFGTYDDVGMFYLPAKLCPEAASRYVVGIAYRKDDVTLDLPDGLPSLILPEADFLVQDIAYEYQLNDEMLDEIILYAAKRKNENSDRIKFLEDGLVVAFSIKEKLRIMHEVEKLSHSNIFLSDNYEEHSKEELFVRAYKEPITNYYNWTWMWERLAMYYEEGITDYGFVHFDIKDFKMVNELYNHEVGNEVLRRVTRNIEANKDWIYSGARCDNDNFALMIKDMPEEETREKLQKFFDNISSLEEDPSYRLYYRCGVVCMRNAMKTGDTVADCAKLAQYSGTRINVTEINFYTDEMHENFLWGKYLKAYLDTAIRDNEFVVYLQPKMNTGDESVCGAEALVRWNYKHKELMMPFRFISHFEADDSIIKVDDLVLGKVCEKLKEWESLGYRLYPISVNLSRKHLEQPNLARHLSDIVDSYEVSHSLIEFELTESATYDNQIDMIAVMKELRECGFLVSMDDFGTGYSSFGLLREMPLDTLKIDKSFIDLITGQDARKSLIILRHIISMARDLGINCIAEGAEDYNQILVLKELGCETVQGYYYSKPIPMEFFEGKYLRRG